MISALESSAKIVVRLGLIHHDEGGWFRETYRSPETVDCPGRPGMTRPLLTTIYYLLDRAAPRGVLHRNRSDIVHLHVGGGVLRYGTLTPEGVLSEHLLGPDHEHQFTVPGGVWKATELVDGDWGMAWEAVSPGFDYRDRDVADRNGFLATFPQHAEVLTPFLSRPDSAS